MTKSQKSLFFFIIIHRKKCQSLSFPILGGRDLTPALQSSPFKKSREGVAEAWQKTEMRVSNMGFTKPLVVQVVVQVVHNISNYCLPKDLNYQWKTDKKNEKCFFVTVVCQISEPYDGGRSDPWDLQKKPIRRMPGSASWQLPLSLSTAPYSQVYR